MKILDSTRPLSELVNDDSNGLGQIQPIECVVTEELNGIYECEFTVPITDKHYKDLKDNGLIKVTVGDGSEQIFRVYEVGQPINLVSTFKCAHITYDLNKVVVKPFTATGAVNIKNQLVSNMLGSYPFSTWTDITNTTSTFTNDIPRYFRECLGGYEGSVLDVLRPEYEWDNLTVKLHARRGADNGVRISYGKNLIDYSQEQNNENVYDGVYGYAVVDEVTYKADSYYNKTGATYPRILNVDFSSDYESGQIPTSAELLQKATTYAQNNSIEVPSINIKIDFIPLWQTEEYKNILPLERVSLGDTVHVYFDKLNVEASSRVIKTQWNVLTNKYDSIELGDAKANLNTIINDSVSTAVDEAVSDLDIDVGWLDTKAENMFKLIANGVGLHITKDSAGRIILHNEEDISQSKYQYMITAQGFMMSDDYGQEGSWRSGWTTSGDAYMNSLSTITLRALEIYGSYIYGTDVQGSRIIFGDPNDTSGKYITAQQYDADGDTNYDGVSFDGTGYVRFQPQEQFIVNNLTANGDLLNEFVMSSSGTVNQAYIVLKNYDHTQNYIPANSIELDEHYREATSEAYRNVLQFNNYFTGTGTSNLGNQILFEADVDGKGELTITNNTDNNVKGNQLYMYSHTDMRMFNVTNTKINSTSTSNVLEMNAFLSSSNDVSNISLRNYQSANTNLANSLSMNADSQTNTARLTNQRFGYNRTGNEIYELANSTYNKLQLLNYDTDSTRLSDSLEMAKSSAENWITLALNRGGQTLGVIRMEKDSSQNFRITLATYDRTVNNTVYYGTSVELDAILGKVQVTARNGMFVNGTRVGG